MPLFHKKGKSQGYDSANNNHQDLDSNNLKNINEDISQRNMESAQQQQPTANKISRTQLVFHCQLAHGSPTGFIKGFSSVKELYQKIAECYEITPDEIIFCTLNTHKIDMGKLLGGQIGLDDFIFAHRKGQPKEIEIIKSEDALGLTITDNGVGYAFIKRIKEDSIIDKLKHILVGDHIEKINEQSVVGKRHFEVARMLKDIPRGSTFTLRLVEPMKSGFQGIGPRDSRSGVKSKSSQNYGSGKETLRFKANGQVEICNKSNDMEQAALDAINLLLDSFLGINDTDLATQIWELGKNKTNSMDFAEALDNSDLDAFGFTDDFIIELWGAITDAKQGRTKPKFVNIDIGQ
ncbi:PDZ domain-containing protein GIPC3 [Condylostylus longicornis]|uniref:PDZ domain-containing protein GIPC3 n=1 Tax=Condylostylus longicornis TaxID=2530218 RepID=UPI00244DB457|nr:PDZ domain-containing protein GIPC3 [Condylostylus longicornis]XP_055372846.1 PDZ domain-containing protein GIPC3 [Condylostylus longicornis]XP_055372847.1 PDZ domain-containing protein GIPC3 [Condylostylus longicornis]